MGERLAQRKSSNSVGQHILRSRPSPATLRRRASPSTLIAKGVGVILGHREETRNDKGHIACRGSAFLLGSSLALAQQPAPPAQPRPMTFFITSVPIGKARSRRPGRADAQCCGLPPRLRPAATPGTPI